MTRVLSSINFARNSTSDLIMSVECRCILLNRTVNFWKEANRRVCKSMVMEGKFSCKYVAF